MIWIQVPDVHAGHAGWPRPQSLGRQPVSADFGAIWPSTIPGRVMSELTGPAEIHNGLALYQRGQGYPLLANAIPARLGRALETAAFCARQAPAAGRS
jgi:hypothetical protein